MGCGSSKGVAPIQKEAKTQDISESTFIFSSSNSIKLAYDFMVKNAHSYPLCYPMIPIVCMEEKAFPILLHDICFQESSAIQLPIISGAFYGKGRIIAIPNINVFSEISSNRPEDETFLSNVVSWLCKNETTMAPILLYNFPDVIEEEVCYFLHNHGFFAEKSKCQRKALSSYRSIFLSTEFEPTPEEIEEFANYVSNGGSLFVGFLPLEQRFIDGFFDLPINQFLLKFGLSYTLYTIESDDVRKPNPTLRIKSSQFSTIQQSHFIALFHHLDEVLSAQKEPEASDLDDIVTALRYHIIVIGEGIQKHLSHLFSSIFSYFIKSHVINPEKKFCPLPTQCILMNLIQDILPRTPPKYFFPIIGYEIFPGESVLSSEFQSIQNHKCEYNDSDSKFELCQNPNSNGEKVLTTDILEFEIIDETWISTGLYLPAGILGFIELDQPHPEIHVQIGSHMESLDSKNSPWPRWPNIISAYALDDLKVQVSTLFGGIVYIAASSLLPTPLHITLKFINFLPYPHYVKSDPSFWEKTRESQMPFGEIDGDHIIVSLPSKDIFCLEAKLPTILSTLDKITEIITNYLSFKSERSPRIVFDNAMDSNNPLVGYPILYPLSDLSPLFNEIERPSHYLFALSNLIALVSIREDCFDQEVEYALSELAASVAFSKLFSDFNPDRFSSDHARTLFKALWQIHTEVGEDIIPKSIAKFQSPSYSTLGVPEDTWLEFVKEICIVSKTDLTPTLQAIRPFPLNFNATIRHLPIFTTAHDLSDVVQD